MNQPIDYPIDNRFRYTKTFMNLRYVHKEDKLILQQLVAKLRGKKSVPNHK